MSGPGNGLRIGIDAVNLRGGGGLTHLRQIMEVADPARHNFERITVWGGRKTLDSLPEGRDWLDARGHPWLDGGIAKRTLWRRRHLPRELIETSDILFAPGGLLAATSLPRVTMCRNMLPFDPVERRRYPPGYERLRLELLLREQSRSFLAADGVIFLTDYARESVLGQLKGTPRAVATIPHGVSPRFARQNRAYRSPEECNATDPFRLVYVSTVNRYKHQWTVVEAVARLRASGLPVALDLAGGGEKHSVARLNASLAEHDPGGDFVTYHGAIPFDQVHELYHAADATIFASSCENLPNILLEAMLSGAPVLSSDRGPMPEVLGEGGLYFDPENADSLVKALHALLADPAGRAARVETAITRAEALTWPRCADATFAFLNDIASGAT